MMSTFNRMALGGLSGLMLLGGALPGEPAARDASAAVLILEWDNPSLEMADGILSLFDSPVTATLVEHYADGALKRSEAWVDGRRHGSSVSWYGNGQMNELRVYVDGRKEGQHMGWYADGTLHFDYDFRLGLHEGNALEWYPSGILYRDFNYAAGQESGPQRMWNVDGSLRANYVVRDGRRFGLIGAKGCTGEPVDASTLYADEADSTGSPGSAT